MTNTLTFTYTNWRGITRSRTVTPVSIEYMTSEWHEGEQWILLAVDPTDNIVKEFAMKDIAGID